MRQIDVAHQAEDQGKAARHQEINPAERNAVEDRVEKDPLAADGSLEPGRRDRKDQPQQDRDRNEDDQRPCRMTFDELAHDSRPATPRLASADASRSAACLAIDAHPPKGRDLLWDRVWAILTGAQAADLIESIIYRSAGRPSGTQHLGRAA